MDTKDTRHGHTNNKKTSELNFTKTAQGVLIYAVITCHLLWEKNKKKKQAHLNE